MQGAQQDLNVSALPSGYTYGRTGVEEDTGRSSVKDTTDDTRLGTVTVIRLPDS